MPFQSIPYYPDRRDSLTMLDLMRQRGDIAARGALGSGMVWGNVINQLGQIGAQAYQGYQQGKQQELEQEQADARSALFAEAIQDEALFQDPQRAMRTFVEIGYSPEESLAFAKAAKTLWDTKDEKPIDPARAFGHARTLAQAYMAAGPAEREMMKPGLVGWAESGGLDPEGQLRAYPPEQFDAFIGSIAEQEEPESLDPVVRDFGDRIMGVDPTSGEELWSKAKGIPPKAPGGGESSLGDLYLGGARDEAALAQVPEAWRELVKGVSEYRVDPRSLGRDKETRKAIFAWATQVNPEFDQTRYTEAATMRREYASGQNARNITAINTLAHHTTLGIEVVDAIENGNIQRLNQLKNAFFREFGDADVTNFNAVSKVIADEMANTFKASGATDPQIAQMQGILNAAQSPAQLKEALAYVAKLVQGRIDAIGSKYDATFGEGAFRERGFVSPEAQHAFDTLAAQAGGGAPVGGADLPPETVKALDQLFGSQ